MDTPLIDANPTHYLKRIDRDTPPLQFVRELIQNGIEAQATAITIEPLELQLELPESGNSITVEKFMVTDNGEGMTPEKMLNNLAKMNSSSKSSNSEHHENFGIGAKITTAMWNPHGVVFCSWHKDDPDNGHLVWLHYNKDFNQICLKGIPIEYAIDDGEGGRDIEEGYITSLINGRKENIIPLLDEDGEAYIIDGIDFTQLKPKSGHGTVVILLGESDQDNTWTDSNKNPLTNRALRYYLNTRYASMPDTVKIIDGRRGGQIKGFNVCLNTLEDNFVLSRDLVKCPNGFKVEVITTKDHGEWYKEYKERRGITGHASPANDNFMQADFNKGFVALQYKTKHGTQEFYNIEKGAKVLYQWGINAKSLIGRVKIIVHPPQYNGVRGVYPNEGRYRLQWMDNESQLNSNEIDLTEVKEHFVNNHPKALRDLIDKAYANYEAKGVDVDKILDRYKPIINIKKNSLLDEYEIDKEGNIIFEGKGKEKREKRNNKGTHGRGNGESERNAKGNAKVKGKIRKKKALKPITARWLIYEPGCDDNVTDAFEENGFVYPIFIEEINNTYVLNMMKNHEELFGIITYFHQKKKTMTTKVVEEVVKEQYVGFFHTYIRTLEGTKVLNRQEYLSKEALHAKIIGSSLLWDRVSNALGFVGK